MSAGQAAGGAVYEFGEFRFEAGDSRLLRRGEPLHLEPKALRVLAVLIERAGSLVERDTLLDLVWNDVVVTPGTLTRLIAELRRGLGDDPAEPRFIATVHTRGYRWVAALRRTAPTPGRSNLPERSLRLIGRDADLARVAELHATRRLVTIAGPGGAGKTQLALEFGRRLAASGPRACVWVDLSSAGEAGSIARLAAQELRVNEREDLSLDVAIANALGERELTLLLDNCEAMVLPVATLARVLLARCPNVSLVCTSQATLDVPEETIHWLAPLALPDARWREAAEPTQALLAAEAVQLLVERARAVVPSFALTAANAEAIAGICARVDGLPLAIELAAARLSALTPHQLLRALDDGFAVLSRSSEAVGARFRSLRGAIEWSFGLLDRAERETLALLGVFSGSFSLEAAHAVAGDAGAPVATLDRVQSLVQKSLLAVERGGEEVRYRLLDSVKAFARERLEASGLARDAYGRHAAFFASVAHAADAELLQADQAVWIDRLWLEWANLAAAVDWARANGADPSLRARLMSGARFYFKNRSSYVEALDWFRDANELCEALPPLEVARIQNGLATTQLYMLRAEPGLRSAEAAFRAASEARDDWEIAHACAVLAWWAAIHGDAARERVWSGRAREAADRAGDPWVKGYARYGAMFSAFAAEDWSGALAVTEEIAAFAERSGDRNEQRFVAIYQGLAAHHRGDVKALLRALDRVAGLTFVPRGHAGGAEIAGYHAMAMGDAELAARLLASAERVREQSIAPLFPPWHAPNAAARERARAALGAARFEAAWEAGRRLPVEVAFAEGHERVARDAAR